MLRLLAAAAALALSGTLLLTGCGSDTPDAAEDPTPTATPTSTPAEPEPSTEPEPTVTSSTPAEPGRNGEEQARAFRAFARGGSDLPPLADQVDLYLGNAFTGFVTRSRADDARAWATCTEIGDYAGRACPISPLDVLAEHGAVAYAGAPDSRCLQTYGPVPPDLRRLTRISIVPAPGTVDSCIDDFAVQLFSNPDGDLVAVSLLMGEP